MEDEAVANIGSQSRDKRSAALALKFTRVTAEGDSVALRFFVVPVRDSAASEADVNGFLGCHKIMADQTLREPVRLRALQLAWEWI